MFTSIPVWIKAPFLRLLIPLAVGIFLQWECRFPTLLLWSLAISTLALLSAWSFLPLNTRFKKAAVAGFLINVLIFSLGGLLLIHEDIRNDPRWLGQSRFEYVLATITDPPVARSHSFKATASVIATGNDQGKLSPAHGNLVVYFSLACHSNLPAYGAAIIIKGKVEPLKNTGNPGGFDYAAYCLFQGITHQAFLNKTDYFLPHLTPAHNLDRFVFECRSKVVAVMKKFIKGEKESGLAEALLIGYKDDLDRDLVQSYSDTGVVHIIAISGMHLALIYALLLWLTRKLGNHKTLRMLRVLLVLSGLWLFTLMAGAQASVVRSAVMFTCIALGALLERKTSVYNTLSAAAFILLCYRPFWLWDAGFQLSYAAVISIVLLYRPVYGWLFFTNKLVDGIWKTAAISIAAQMLTTPFSLYYFHQFPLLFIFTNLAAIPLSTVILFACLLICVLAFFPLLAGLAGSLAAFLIFLMNHCIELVRRVPFALWTGINISAFQAFLLLVMAALLIPGAINRTSLKWMLFLFSLFFFTGLHTRTVIQSSRQVKLIVYNIPGRKAIHFIAAGKAILVTDSLKKEETAYRFSILPSLLQNRVSISSIFYCENADLEFAGKKMVLLSRPLRPDPATPKKIDLLLVSGNTEQPPGVILKILSPALVVLDGTVPAWKRKEWKTECSERNTPYYSVADEGSFVMNFQPLPL